MDESIPTPEKYVAEPIDERNTSDDCLDESLLVSPILADYFCPSPAAKIINKTHTSNTKLTSTAKKRKRIRFAESDCSFECPGFSERLIEGVLRDNEQEDGDIHLLDISGCPSLGLDNTYCKSHCEDDDDGSGVEEENNENTIIEYDEEFQESDDELSNECTEVTVCDEAKTDVDEPNQSASQSQADEKHLNTLKEIQSLNDFWDSQVDIEISDTSYSSPCHKKKASSLSFFEAAASPVDKSSDFKESGTLLFQDGNSYPNNENECNKENIPTPKPHHTNNSPLFISPSIHKSHIEKKSGIVSDSLNHKINAFRVFSDNEKETSNSKNKYDREELSKINLTKDKFENQRKTVDDVEELKSTSLQSSNDDVQLKVHPKSPTCPSPTENRLDSEMIIDNENETSKVNISSARKKINRTSEALIDRLRAAQRRKLIAAENSSSTATNNNDDIKIKVPTVKRWEPQPHVRKTTTTTKASLPKRERKGINPYRPFKARPLPATTGDFGAGGQVGVPKVPKRQSTNATSPIMGAQRLQKTREPTNHKPSHPKQRPLVNINVGNKLPKEENPYKPFKARPPPLFAKGSPATKPDHIRRPVQPKQYVNKAALRAKPFQRVASGKQASVAKESAMKQKIQQEEADAKQKSTFRARPIPLSVMSPPLMGMKLLNRNSACFSTGGSDGGNRKRHTPLDHVTKSPKTQPKQRPPKLHTGIRAKGRKEFEIRRQTNEMIQREQEKRDRKKILREKSAELETLRKSLL